MAWFGLAGKAWVGWVWELGRGVAGGACHYPASHDVMGGVRRERLGRQGEPRNGWSSHGGVRMVRQERNRMPGCGKCRRGRFGRFGRFGLCGLSR